MKYLIVGLGNPGEKYAETRHNIGFKVLDHLAKEDEKCSFSIDRLGDVATYKFKGRTLVLLKPSTYMNLSGKALNYWMQQEKIPTERVLVITDDLALPFGKLRMKGKGSDGGHNGLKDIQEKLNTVKYNRFRFGISDKFLKGSQVDYVLGQWTDEEFLMIQNQLEKTRNVLMSFVMSGVNSTMNQYNGI